MKNYLIFPVILFSLCLISCSSLKVVSDYDNETNFDNYSTYSIAELDMERANINELNLNRIVKAIKSEMNNKGFKETKKGDLEIHVHGLVENQVSTTATTDYYGSSYPYYRRRIGWGTAYGTTTVDVQEYRKGTLIVDLVDRADEKLVWQGLGSSVLPDNTRNLEERIQKAVSKIMADFPPGK